MKNSQNIMFTSASISKTLKKKQVQQVQLELLKKLFSSMSIVAPRLTASYAFKKFMTPRKLRSTPFPKELLQSAAEYYLPYEGKRLKVYSWGFHGPKVLLVHGWESKAATFRNIIPTLLEAGFSVISFDAPAHGNSGGKTLTMPRYAGAIKLICDYHANDGGVQYVLGHSFGGLTAAYTLSEYDLNIQKLVLVSMPTNVKRIIGEFCGFLGFSSTIADKMIDKVESLTEKPIDSFGILNMKDEIKAKSILAIHDTQDRQVSYAHMEEMIANWDKPNYITTSSLGHNKTIKNPEIIGRISNFLTD